MRVATRRRRKTRAGGDGTTGRLLSKIDRLELAPPLPMLTSAEQLAKLRQRRLGLSSNQTAQSLQAPDQSKVPSIKLRTASKPRASYHHHSFVSYSHS